MYRIVQLHEAMHFSGALATDATGKLHVLGHDGHALCVHGAEVGVLEETHEVGLAGLLERQHRLCWGMSTSHTS